MGQNNMSNECFEQILTTFLRFKVLAKCFSKIFFNFEKWFQIWYKKFKNILSIATILLLLIYCCCCNCSCSCL